MKESVTKFDLEAAFKALDEIDLPVAEKGIKANRLDLKEMFSRKSKFDALMEEYYDVGSTAELEDAQEAREAEVAKAKLERIEKIVDLDADSPEDLLTSYVGKHIIQCPQCMTLFYKDPEDIVESEDDPKTVNVNEICQHCGHEAGYTLIGKVGEAEPGEFEEPAVDDAHEEEIPVDAEEPAEEEAVDLEDIGDINLDLDVEEDEVKEESFNTPGGEALVEEFSDDPELDDKLKAQDEYIEYLRTAIDAEKEKLEKASNEQVKVAIQRNIDAFEADLEAALPEAVKSGEATVTADVAEVEEVAEIDAEVEESFDQVNDTTLNEGLLIEATGAETKAAAQAIIDEVAKDDEKTWASKAATIVDAIPEEDLDSIITVIGDKFKDIKLSAEARKKLADESEGTIEVSEDADTLGKVLALFDMFEWAKNHPKLVKRVIVLILTIIGLFYPPVHIASIIVGILPADVVAYVAAALNVTTPTGTIGTAANQAYKAKKNKKAQQATEALHEEADLDVSADEFNELINSPEFKKPISSAEVRAIMDKEEEEENVEECADSTSSEQPLTEAITRAGTCDWVLKKAVDKNGQQKYDRYIVVCLADTIKANKKVKQLTEPLANPVEAINKGLVQVSSEFGRPEAKTKYKDAENIAKGRSSQRGCGSVLIFLAKENNLAKASFLCQYFKGKLHEESDQLNSYVQDIKGAKKAAKGGSDQSDFEKVAAKDLKPGSKVKLANGNDMEVASVEQSDVDSTLQHITLSGDAGSKELHVSAQQIFTVIRGEADVAFESLNNTMSGLDELHEETLEAAIANSLIESYGNVAGFRLAKCDYVNNNLTVDGTIFFTSGNTRKTTYAFNESYNAENGKISLLGTNKKLGLDKQFTLTGRIENKTLITESFKRSK